MSKRAFDNWFVECWNALEGTVFYKDYTNKRKAKKDFKELVREEIIRSRRNYYA